MTVHKKNRLRYRKQTSGYHWGERREERQIRGLGLRDTNTMFKIVK